MFAENEIDFKMIELSHSTDEDVSGGVTYQDILDGMARKEKSGRDVHHNGRLGLFCTTRGHYLERQYGSRLFHVNLKPWTTQKVVPLEMLKEHSRNWREVMTLRRWAVRKGYDVLSFDESLGVVVHVVVNLSAIDSITEHIEKVMI